MARGTSTNGTRTTLSNTLAATSLVSDESRIPEDGLYYTGPNNQQRSAHQIDQTVHCRVF